MTAYVELGFRVSYRLRSATRLRARARLRGPKDALRRKRTVYFYFYKYPRRYARLIGRTRLRGGRIARGTKTLRVPRRWGRRDVVFACLREPRGDPWGKPVKALRRCGRSRL